MVAPALAVTAIAAGGYALLSATSHSTPEALRLALARYRALQGWTTPSGEPAPGVYAYAVRGWERGDRTAVPAPHAAAARVADRRPATATR